MVSRHPYVGLGEGASERRTVPEVRDLPPLLTVVVVVTLFVLAIALERRASRVVLAALAALLTALALLLQHVR